MFCFHVTPKTNIVVLQISYTENSRSYNSSNNKEICSYYSINYYLLFDPLHEAMTLNSARLSAINSDVLTTKGAHLIRLN